MKVALTAVLLMLATVLGAGLTPAAPPLVMDHTLIGQNTGDTTTALDYSLHLKNNGETGLSELSLYLVPLPPLRGSAPPLAVGYLGPHEEIDVPVQVVTPVQLDVQRLALMPLFWAGKYLDADGHAVEFPARSLYGGAR